MARIKKTEKSVTIIDPPAMTPEDQEDQLISLAVDLALQRLKDGTASNQLVSEILKLGTTKERLQKEKLKRENDMLRAKTEAIEAQKHTDEMYKKALDAMRTYAGLGRYYEDDEDEEYEEDYT